MKPDDAAPAGADKIVWTRQAEDGPAPSPESGAAAMPPPVHKKPKKRGPVSAFFAAIGNLFYTIGFAAEYRAVTIWRVLRDVGAFVGQMAMWLGGAAWDGLKTLSRSVWRDITEPVVQFRHRRRQLRRARERAQRRGESAGGEFRGAGVKTSAILVARLGSYLLPVLAAAALVFTVYNVMGMRYALRVEINGAELGFVADQSVVEGAKGLLRDRIQLAKNQELSDWQLEASYSIARTQEFTTTRDLANEILLSSPQEEGAIVPATGLYIDGELVTVTTEGERLREYLDGLIAAQEAAAPEQAKVSFVKEVVCEPESDDLYFVSSVEDSDAIIRRLGSDERDEKRVTADGAATLETIAHDNGLALDELLERNPGVAEEARTVAEEEEISPGEYAPAPGEAVLIEPAEPFLQVQTCVRERSEEVIPYESIEEENPERSMNTRRVLQEGAEGLREVWDDVYYVDGAEDRRERVEELTHTLAEPVPEIVEVGTMEASFAPTMPIGGYGDGFIFPVPESPYSGRGYSGGHQAMDINAPAGTPIYACQGGTVVTAGTHWSYGNYIVIDHGGGIQTLYAHCIALYVSAGQQVSQGQNIAGVGNTGYSFGNHLHLEVQVNGARTDPQPYVGYPY